MSLQSTELVSVLWCQQLHHHHLIWCSTMATFDFSLYEGCLTCSQ